MPATKKAGVSLPYPVVCALLGLLVAWIPAYLHGPIAEKYNVLYIQGAVAVWGWYTGRCFIGLLVGLTSWPERWWLRGPFCGFLCMFPLGLVSLATPGCGFPCMMWNQATAWTIGAFTAGVAYALTGQQRR